MQKLSRKKWLLNWFVGKASKKPQIQEMMTEMIASKEAQENLHSPLVYVQNLDVLGDIMDNSLADIDEVFLDLDGTIYLGGELIPGALDFLERCKSKGKAFFSVKQF